MNAGFIKSEKSFSECVAKKFGLRKCQSKKILGSKSVGLNKIWVKKISGPNIFWVQEIFGPNRYWTSQFLGLNKMSWSENVWVKTNLGQHKFGFRKF